MVFDGFLGSSNVYIWKKVRRTRLCMCSFDSPWSITYDEVLSVFSYTDFIMEKKTLTKVKTCFAFFSKLFFHVLSVSVTKISPPF